jgi:hypothetical protein
MKISEVINYLGVIKRQYGDIDVFLVAPNLQKEQVEEETFIISQGEQGVGNELAIEFRIPQKKTKKKVKKNAIDEM